jgi:hypothetical protein
MGTLVSILFLTMKLFLIVNLISFVVTGLSADAARDTLGDSLTCLETLGPLVSGDAVPDLFFKIPVEACVLASAT